MRSPSVKRRLRRGQQHLADPHPSTTSLQPADRGLERLGHPEHLGPPRQPTTAHPARHRGVVLPDHHTPSGSLYLRHRTSPLLFGNLGPSNSPTLLKQKHPSRMGPDQPPTVDLGQRRVTASEDEPNTSCCIPGKRSARRGKRRSSRRPLPYFTIRLVDNKHVLDISSLGAHRDYSLIP
jgi:hypothetical protein